MPESWLMYLHIGSRTMKQTFWRNSIKKSSSFRNCGRIERSPTSVIWTTNSRLTHLKATTIVRPVNRRTLILALFPLKAGSGRQCWKRGGSKHGKTEGKQRRIWSILSMISLQRQHSSLQSKTSEWKQICCYRSWPARAAWAASEGWSVILLSLLNAPSPSKTLRIQEHLWKWWRTVRSNCLGLKKCGLSQ